MGSAPPDGIAMNSTLRLSVGSHSSRMRIMSSTQLTPLIHFLQNELMVPERFVQTALKHPEHSTQLPMILWQYGLISMEQLGCIFDWLEGKNFGTACAPCLSD
jgi:hypothetical protein